MIAYQGAGGNPGERQKPGAGACTGAGGVNVDPARSKSAARLILPSPRAAGRGAGGEGTIGTNRVPSLQQTGSLLYR